MRPLGNLYPFDSHYLEIDGMRYHYLDEGTGDPVVLLHGNPTWSFYYRKLVRALRTTHRAVVPDHIGCGLSEKPPAKRYPYTLKRRVADLELLLDFLGIDERITLVMHDWGGMIGMNYATRHPEQIKGLVLLNTAAFHLPKGKRLPWQLRFCRNSRLGAILVQGANLFCRAAARQCVVQRPLSPQVRKAYLAPYDSWANRIAVLRFVQDIPLVPEDPAFDLVSEVQGNLGRLAHLPVLICWGERDFVFDRDFLDVWIEYYPRAEVHRFPVAGHYVLEDAADEIVPLVADFLNRPLMHERAVVTA